MDETFCATSMMMEDSFSKFLRSDSQKVVKSIRSYLFVS